MSIELIPMALLSIDAFPLSGPMLIGEGLGQGWAGHACALPTNSNTAPILLTIL